MNNRIFTLCSIFLFASTFLVQSSFAQAPDIEWQKSLGGTNGDAASSIVQTSDGGFIVAGNSKSNDGDITEHHGAAGSDDYWITKLDHTGTIEWQKSFGGTSADAAFSIEPTTDGGYIVTGYTASNDGDVSNVNGSLDCWVVKLLSNGTIDWQKALGGSGVDYGVSIKQTNNGYIVASTSYSADGDITAHHGTSATTDIWIAKLDNSGTLQWQKSLGGDGRDFVSSIGVTSDGGFIISGKSDSTSGDVTGIHGSDDAWIVKIDSIGTIEWQKSLGGTDSDALLSVRQTSDGGYVMAGTSSSNNGDVTGHHGTSANTDYWVVKLHSNGDIAWQKSLGGTANDGGTGIWQNSDGGYFVAGHSFSNDGDVTGHHGTTSTSDYWIVNLDSAGTIQWQKSLGGTSNETNAIYANQQTSDGGFVIAGTSSSTDGDVTGHHGTTSFSDYWIVKLAGAPLGVDETYSSIPETFTLAQNFPNPFNPSTSIQFSLPHSGNTTLKIFNMLGEEVATLISGDLSAGQYIAHWNAINVPSGMYFYRLQSGSYSETKNLILTK